MRDSIWHALFTDYFGGAFLVEECHAARKMKAWMCDKGIVGCVSFFIGVFFALVALNLL